MVQPHTAIAALPMYDFPYLREQTDRFWLNVATEIKKSGIAAPRVLNREDDIWAIWRDPGLIFAQTCGYPLVSQLTDSVTLIGTPDYGVIPNKPGWYNSVVLIRKDDPRDTLAAFVGATLAYSDELSQSGCHALMYTILHEIGEKRVFERCICSGGHGASIKAVADGHADLTAVDAVTWSHLQHMLSHSLQLRVLMKTVPTPGLPFIAANSCDGDLLAKAAESAIVAMSSEDRKALGLLGLWRSEIGDYHVIRERAIQSNTVLRLHGIGQ